MANSKKHFISVDTTPLVGVSAALAMFSSETIQNIVANKANQFNRNMYAWSLKHRGQEDTMSEYLQYPTSRKILNAVEGYQRRDGTLAIKIGRGAKKRFAASKNQKSSSAFGHSKGVQALRQWFAENQLNLDIPANRLSFFELLNRHAARGSVAHLFKSTSDFIQSEVLPKIKQSPDGATSASGNITLDSKGQHMDRGASVRYTGSPTSVNLTIEYKHPAFGASRTDGMVEKNASQRELDLGIKPTSQANDNAWQKVLNKAMRNATVSTGESNRVLGHARDIHSGIIVSL